ncbi:hypothetical protein SH591_06260 [Sphingomonas sp. LY54]|uniref:hypothetical protein n=1 Tax=Sphingomonas sp. LY54 TaxID=3095343 RepID=UPI002D76B79D|nr:hypothetical protein [Sphingomonas sp. LY54]WRP29782.1 hypothetical protein SH591_06260 [Sphingomonas sp. LY54]
MGILKYGVAAALVFTASLAFADKFFAITPSGSTEMLFPDRPEATIGKLSSKCIDAQWRMITSSPRELACEAPLNFGQAVLGQMLMTTATPPLPAASSNVAEVRRSA